MYDDGDPWSLLVPVKRLDRAKTRLALPDDVRMELALAMATDTVRAGLAAGHVGEVVAISDDPRAVAALGALGARVVADQPDAGLNPALSHGASVARNERVAALSSDLPALRGPDLDALLERAAEHPASVVADVAGTGTTLLAALSRAGFAPRFGAESFAAHRAAGAVDVSDLAATSLRQDVDTVEGLAAAAALGVGPATEGVLATLRGRRRH